MTSEMQELIFAKMDLAKENQTFFVRRKVKKINSKLDKLIKAEARKQGDRVAKEYYDFLSEIIEANF